FVHGAPNVIAGDVLALDVRAYGFPTATVADPLRDATLVAAWDPESLGVVAAAPPDVTTTTGSLGEARLDVPVPIGGARKITLLVSVRHGEHVRTRKVEVERQPRTQVELHVPDVRVVPGSETPAWVVVSDARTGAASANAAVEVAFLEGDV